MGDLKLLGYWSSPFVHRVIWALKHKGISYHFIEQDRYVKSELLLRSNPIYQKVPVLIHQGKPIAESLVILEYIEETWPHNPLLPQLPHDRALARFWIKFGDDSIGSVFTDLYLQPSKDEQEREIALKKAHDILTVVEEQGLGDKKFFGGNEIGMVDIAYGILTHWLQGYEEIVGFKLIEPNKFPRLHAWTQNFKQVPVIRENLPDYEKLLLHLEWRRQKTQGHDYGYPIPADQIKDMNA